MANKGTNLQVPISPNGLRGFLIKLVGFVDLLLEKSSADPVALTGSELSELNIRGLNVQAMRYADGSIVGSSSYGSFVLWPNGRAECEFISAIDYNATSGPVGTIYYSTLTLPYPIEFIEYPKGIATASWSSGITWASQQDAKSKTSMIMWLLAESTSWRGYPVYRAIGRWK